MPLLSVTIQILSTWQGKNDDTDKIHGKLMEPAGSCEIQITVGPTYGSHNLDSDDKGKYTHEMYILFGQSLTRYLTLPSRLPFSSRTQNLKMSHNFQTTQCQINGT
jgi:hypothetical protein